MLDDRILKVKFPKEKRTDGLSSYPWNILPFTPPYLVFSTPIAAQSDSMCSHSQSPPESPHRRKCS